MPAQKVRRPMLAPGLRVIEVGPNAVQVGLDPTRAIRLPRTPATMSALRLLSVGGQLGTDGTTQELLTTLSEHELLVDSSILAGHPSVRRGDLAAAAATDPTGWPERLRRRRCATVAHLGEFPVDPAPLLAAAGVPLGTADPDVVLVTVVGELDRDALDPLVRAETPHVVVRLVDGVATVGPFVEPGRTACLRCIDAHHDADQPGYSERLRRYVVATARPRDDAVSEPVDTAIATIATAWGVRDVVSHLDGDRPSTWSTTVRLLPAMAEVVSVSWWRHPACGCGWSSVTMEE
ncbi:MAG: hypothetical protein M3Z50_12585 [Actinomycetota bacterium]|nr:hypothetical protein [Actinomycetota bacterium]